MNPNYCKPNPRHTNNTEFKTKVSYLKYYPFTAIIRIITNLFMNIKMMDELSMYNTLLSTFQGQEHEEDKAVNGATEFERLKF